MRGPLVLLAGVTLGGALAACAALLDLDGVQYDGGPTTPIEAGNQDASFVRDASGGDGNGGATKLLWHTQLTAGDAGAVTAVRLRTDPRGAMLLAGTFTGTLDFGRGALPGSVGAYVAKLLPDGGVSFARSLAGPSAALYDVATDKEDGGGVYAAGYSSNDIDLGDASANAGPGVDGYLFHYAANGALASPVRQLTGLGDQRFVAVNVLSTGATLVFGDTRNGGAMSYCGSNNPSTVDGLVLGVCPKNGAGNLDVLGGIVASVKASSATLDEAEHHFIAGYAEGSVDFGSGVTLDAGAGGTFVARLGVGGWARTLGPAPGQLVYNIAPAPQSSGVVAAGFFTQTITLGGAHHDPDGKPAGTTTYDTAGAPARAFVVRFDASGNQIWSNVYGGPGQLSFTGVAIDSNGDVAVVGPVAGGVDFGLGVTSGQADLAILKLDKDGNHAWSRRIAATGAVDNGFTPYWNQVAFDPVTHDVLVFATFNGVVDLGGDAGRLTAKAVDALLLRYSP